MFSEQVFTDHRCEGWVHKSFSNPNKLGEMVTHYGTHLSIFQ